MNARSILDDTLRKNVAHLNTDQIRDLLAHLERDVFQLKVFLKLYDKLKSPARHQKKTSRALLCRLN